MVTVERFFFIVDYFMSTTLLLCNFASLVEILITVVTVEWLFLGVESFMVSQLTSFDKFLVTVVTMVYERPNH